MSCGATEAHHVHRLAEAVRPLLVGAARYEPEPDPLRICMLACLDFQMRGTAVEKSLHHFYHEAAGALGIRDLATLTTYLEKTPSDEEAAVALWGARYWTRLALLRQLIAFFRECGATGPSSVILSTPPFILSEAKNLEGGQAAAEIEAMRRWGRSADFKRDFQGKVKGLGYNTFVRMVQQLGANTAAPTGWTCHYVDGVLGMTPKDGCLVEVLNAAADTIGQPRAHVDWAIRRRQAHP